MENTLERRGCTSDKRLARAVQMIRRRKGAIVGRWSDRHFREPEMARSVDTVFGSSTSRTMYEQQYLNPLFELLCGALGHSGAAWPVVYVDERQRFLAGMDEGAKRYVLKGVIEDDMSAVLDELATDFRAIAEHAAQEIHRPLLTQIEGTRLRLALVGDCVMTEARAFLAQRARESGIDLETRHVYFSANQGIAPRFDSVLAMAQRAELDLIALSYLTFDGMPPYRALLADAGRLTKEQRRDHATGIVRTIRESLEAVRKVSDIPILLHSACGLPLNRLRRRAPILAPLSFAERATLAELNAQIRELAEATTNTFLVDEVAMTGACGLRRAGAPLFPRTVTQDSVFHTSNFGPLVANAYLPVLKAYASLRKTKVLLVDFDNTLWSGVMADGEVVHDRRAQELLRQLRNSGILLVALSKNDPRNIRWAEMQLSQSDFVAHKISWSQKAASIDELVQELNLAANTFVMIDDNPVERELARQRFGDIVTLDPADDATWCGLECMLKFPNTTQTEEARARTEMYRAAAARREATAKALNYPAMMASLKLRATLRLAKPADLPRVQELVQRTNQFNTTTRRRSAGELEQIMRDPSFRVHVAELGDRFGDLGLVGVALVERTGDALFFDSVVMSCRAMGFGLERLLVAGPLSHGPAWKTARGQFVPTNWNEPAATLFADSGFSEAVPGEWHLQAGKPIVPMPEWLDVSYGAELD